MATILDPNKRPAAIKRLELLWAAAFVCEAVQVGWRFQVAGELNLGIGVGILLVLLFGYAGRMVARHAMQPFQAIFPAAAIAGAYRLVVYLRAGAPQTGEILVWEALLTFTIALEVACVLMLRDPSAKAWLTETWAVVREETLAKGRRKP